MCTVRQVNQTCAPISLTVGVINLDTQFKYLGITVIASKCFKCSFRNLDVNLLHLLMLFMTELKIGTIFLPHYPY